MTEINVGIKPVEQIDLFKGLRAGHIDLQFVFSREGIEQNVAELIVVICPNAKDLHAQIIFKKNCR